MQRNAKKLAVLGVFAILVGVLALSVSAFASSPRSVIGAKQRGAIGGDFHRFVGVDPPDWGVDQQLHKAAKNALTDDKVIVVASQCSSTDDPPTAGSCDGSQSSDEDTAKCPSTWANDQLPDEPRATKGYVCVYVLGGDNFGTLVGTDPIHGVSDAPGDLGSKLGFKIVWGPDRNGDSYVSAVWAYNN